MIVEKYTKALMDALSDEELVAVYEAIAKLALVAKEQKYILIIKSPILSVDEKVKFLSSITECENQKFKNFLKILLINKREDLIKDIYKNLLAKMAQKFNTYPAYVNKIDNNDLKELEEFLSKKFNATIKLQTTDEVVNGIKVYVDVLNVEISLIEERLKQQLLDTILKAI